ncbi:hypothetical protein JMF97_18690 [Micromonospora fiedleri]|uniref:Uncharacterized protein n=1 Tax=Micromonospora fiedleri TaxID=1157498 RepID=A0ABS1UPM2_9ACTN|nr:hypothetical protein [Micromonospora fiedleri]MBL6278189.1 hypothetical protein [Micromonospora fiedleri]
MSGPRSRLRQPDQQPVTSGHVEDPLASRRSQVGERGEDDRIGSYALVAAGRVAVFAPPPPSPAASAVRPNPAGTPQ